MLGVTKLGPKSVGLVERRPRPVETNLVRVAVAGAGVCGTDLHIADDEYPSRPPVTMGHEIAGTVVEVGEGVDSSWVGRRAACETYFSACDACRHCRAGRRNLCEQRRSLGSFEDGGFAPEVVVPALNLHELPPDLATSAGVLCEPLACVCQCLLDPSRVAAGDRVLVIGPGAMGLLSVQVAQVMGARVTCLGLPADERRLELARVLGADAVTRVEGDAFDVVIECSGSAGGISAALEAATRGGRVVQVGIRGRAVEVPWDLILYKELEVSSGFASTAVSWRRAMALVHAGSIELAALVSHVVSIDRWQTAFDLTRSSEAVKVVIDPNQITGPSVAPAGESTGFERIFY